MDKELKYVIGVDIGGTKIAAGLVNCGDGVVLTEVKGSTPKDGNESILDATGDLIEQILKESDIKIDGIGIGIPGYVDRTKGIALTAGNVNYRNMPVTEYIHKRFNIEAYLENDTNAGTLGEKWFGYGRGLKHFIYMAIGTGIGGGLILNDELYIGRGDAGEIGHMIVDYAGGKCVCGMPGCIESIASGTSIARLALARLKAGEHSTLNEKLAGNGQISSEDVISAAEMGDKMAVELMGEIGGYLAQSLVSLVKLLDPEAIIIGGGVSRAKELLQRVILTSVPVEGMKRHLDEIMKFSTWGSGIVGAAAIVLEHNQKSVFALS